MTVFMTKEFFERANRQRVEGATTVMAGRPDKKSLSEVVLGVVKKVAEGELAPVSCHGRGIAFQARSLLALLTYCYVKGIYASQEIEDLMRRDAMFRQCCGGEFPDWRSLRRFRRANHEVIERCVAETLSQARAAENEQGTSYRGMGLTLAQVPEDCRDGAAGRVENAVLMDVMADACDSW